MAFGVSSVGMWEAVLGERLSPFQGHRERQIEVEGGELEYLHSSSSTCLHYPRRGCGKDSREWSRRKRGLWVMWHDLEGGKRGIEDRDNER